MFPILTIPDAAADLPEQLGSRFKFWFRGADSFKYLYKEGREDTGENWAEKVASELCALLELPHAVYDLATWKQRKRVVTRSFVPEKGRLVHGNELLALTVKEYQKTQLHKQRQYVLRSVIAILSAKQFRPPVNSTVTADGVETAMDVFTGYLMFDAWIANQDRHHENWGLILTEGSIHLYPTYDHASGMGRNETDDTRRSKLSSNDTKRGMDAYVRRAVSAFYDSASAEKRLLTLDAFLYAARRYPKAAKGWLERLGSVSSEEIESILSQIPNGEITEPAIQFAQRILCLNRERLLSYSKELT